MNDTIRQKSRTLLQQALGDGSQEAHLADNIEQAIYTLHEDNDTDYKDAIRSHVLNLKDSTNPMLKENVLSGVIDPKDFAEMDASRMASMDRRQSDDVMRRNSIYGSMNMEQPQPMKRDLDDPDAYNP
ncbi:transcription elongation factor S-II [Gongronella butleri]|nr:transcription elongation factor S-II [Gongronella butleri]